MRNTNASFPSKSEIAVHKRAVTIQAKKQEALGLVLDRIRTPEAVVAVLMADIRRRFKNGSKVIEFEQKLNITTFVDWASEARLIAASMTTKERAENIRMGLEKDVRKKLKMEFKEGTFGDVECRLIQGGKLGFKVRVSVINFD